MSEEIENKDVGDIPPEAREPLAGERLAEARRQQQITVLEVAKELHLDEMKVRALEQNKFETLGAPVFAKGHLRKYAQLVGVSIDDLLADYYQLNRASGMPPVVGKVRKQAREVSPGPWIAAIIVVLVVATSYWYFVVRDASVTVAPQIATEPQALDIEPAPVVDEQIIDAPAPEASGLEDSPPDQPVVLPDSAPEVIESQPVAEPVSQALAEGEVRLTMRFSGDCWTEISDASGRRLFFDLGRNGRNVNVSGRGPLSVLFGNAENVAVSVNGEDYTIAAADRRGRTARLTIYAP
ncbi:MAG: DUF4115 domain-containing protein [Gammaproteobacteria bacterium]|nr:DUF4115 domain-containing protein [Gammaproteobacteria bacterium]